MHNDEWRIYCCGYIDQCGEFVRNHGRWEGSRIVRNFTEERIRSYGGFEEAYQGYGNSIWHEIHCYGSTKKKKIEWHSHLHHYKNKNVSVKVGSGRSRSLIDAGRRADIALTEDHFRQLYDHLYSRKACVYRVSASIAYPAFSTFPNLTSETRFNDLDKNSNKWIIREQVTDATPRWNKGCRMIESSYGGTSYSRSDAEVPLWEDYQPINRVRLRDDGTVFFNITGLVGVTPDWHTTVDYLDPANTAMFGIVFADNFGITDGIYYYPVCKFVQSKFDTSGVNTIVERIASKPMRVGLGIHYDTVPMRFKVQCTIRELTTKMAD